MMRASRRRSLNMMRASRRRLECGTAAGTEAKGEVAISGRCAPLRRARDGPEELRAP
eukprot:CAMPEP_0203859240 /NCGR_PEP_ID=MMETSP0359-20131031/11725_1 /ASSEMBLY_ACC=CAM_ASM_000338 /TAXON_ID=268821 /ORGANISM="Scrippsiella Hangoei, Strain SHTV-5" /LENGTH=56 /DNA_ID=CAMNT_0050776109 /DNA_START=287 /DNA_END=454 /DNA_ORIENTATION=+